MLVPLDDNSQVNVLNYHKSKRQRIAEWLTLSEYRKTDITQNDVRFVWTLRFISQVRNRMSLCLVNIHRDAEIIFWCSFPFALYCLYFYHGISCYCYTSKSEAWHGSLPIQTQHPFHVFMPFHCGDNDCKKHSAINMHQNIQSHIHTMIKLCVFTNTHYTDRFKHVCFTPFRHKQTEKQWQ